MPLRKRARHPRLNARAGALDVHQNYRAAQTTLARLPYAKDESRLGVEAARIAQLQYQNGLIALSDVSQAANLGYGAKRMLIDAQVAYVNAIVKDSSGTRHLRRAERGSGFIMRSKHA